MKMPPPDHHHSDPSAAGRLGDGDGLRLAGGVLGAAMSASPSAARWAGAAPSAPSAPAGRRTDRRTGPVTDRGADGVADRVLRTPAWYLRVVKPAMDRVVAALLLLVLGPVLLAAMLAVRVTLGPGVFFVQQRVGLGGRIFSTYKLRTMDHDRRATTDEDLRAYADGRWDGIERRRTHKSAHDPRMNRVGRILRTFSIDEIPQLFNILKGDMSLVGPRPEIPAVVSRHYEPWMHRRHVVKPGLTGLWQVSERGNGMMHEHVDVDLDYVDSIGLWADVRILLATPYAALGPRRGT
jgi:lipopolysaccharide/colanic/teichoic acid biosynthesis glycosyltransferase